MAWQMSLAALWDIVGVPVQLTHLPVSRSYSLISKPYSNSHMAHMSCHVYFCHSFLHGDSKCGGSYFVMNLGEEPDGRTHLAVSPPRIYRGRTFVILLCHACCSGNSGFLCVQQQCAHALCHGQGLAFPGWFLYQPLTTLLCHTAYLSHVGYLH